MVAMMKPRSRDIPDPNTGQRKRTAWSKRHDAERTVRGATMPRYDPVGRKAVLEFDCRPKQMLSDCLVRLAREHDETDRGQREGKNGQDDQKVAATGQKIASRAEAHARKRIKKRCANHTEPETLMRSQEFPKPA